MDSLTVVCGGGGCGCDGSDEFADESESADELLERRWSMAGSLDLGSMDA